MPKPIDKKDQIFRENYARLDDMPGVEEKIKREEKKIWKKARTKHLRNKAKKELRNEL